MNATAWMGWVFGAVVAAAIGSLNGWLIARRFRRELNEYLFGRIEADVRKHEEIKTILRSMRDRIT